MVKKIMLMCSGGMSTSLLVTKMKKVATATGYDAEIAAYGCSDAESVVAQHQPDVLLLGPQVRYLYNELSTKLDLPVGVINTMDYGMMDGEKVLKQAQTLLSK